MKKIFMILCMALISVGAFAEKGDIYVGVDGKYYTGEKSNMGLGAKLQWQCLKHIRLEGNTSYFFESDDSRYIFAKANAHFLINLGKDNFNFYPLAGVVYRNEKYDYTTNETKGGISNSSTVNKTQTKTDNAVNVLVGAGFECPISKKVKFNVECDYIYMDYVTLSVGLAVKL